MKIGVSIPRLPDAEGIREFSQRAEQLGFESVMAGDHVVLPVAGTNQYPYTPTGAFQRPSDEPFLETMTMLGYMAACTSEIRLGSTVLILPYRNPVVQAKMFASLDVLSGGRVICGVGVGWLEKEFDILGVPYADRGPMTDEFLEIFNALWTEEVPEHKGKYYQIDGIYFEPKTDSETAHPDLGGRPYATGVTSHRQVRRLLAHHAADPPTLWPRICPICGSKPERAGPRSRRHHHLPEAQPALHRHARG